MRDNGIGSRLCAMKATPLLLLVITLLTSECSAEQNKRLFKKSENRRLENEGKMHGKNAVACSETRKHNCCGDGVCSNSEDENTCLADCPGVTTQPQCGEEPHSDRGGRTISFGVGHRAKSAQDCCDKCTTHAKSGRLPACNSWTFCGYPVCWGLDTGWNHTFGECWLRHLEGEPKFGQRGAYEPVYRQKMLHTRKACTTDMPGGMSDGWSCPPTQ